MNQFWQYQAQLYVRRYWQHGVLGLLGLLILYQVVSLGFTLFEIRKIDYLIAQAQNPGASAEEDNQGGNHQEARQPENDIFHNQNIPYQLTGIFMDQAIIDNRTVKVGERVGEAEVKEIGNDFVVIQEDGKDNPRRLTLFDQRGGGPPGRGRGRPPSRGRPDRRPQEAPRGDVPEPPQEQDSGSDDITWDQIQNMNMEERRDYFTNLSEDERNELRDRFRDQIRQGGGAPRGGGGGPRGGRGGGGGGRDGGFRGGGGGR